MILNLLSGTIPIAHNRLAWYFAHGTQKHPHARAQTHILHIKMCRVRRSTCLFGSIMMHVDPDDVM